MYRLARHNMPGTFVFLLMCVFAVCCMFTLLMGAYLYRGIVDHSDIHNGERIFYGYLLNTVHGADVSGAVSVVEEAGVTALRLDDDNCFRYIYCLDGNLMELYVLKTDEFKPYYGETICAAAIFEPAIEGQLLHIDIAGADGEIYATHVALNCAPAEGAQR